MFDSKSNFFHRILIVEEILMHIPVSDLNWTSICPADSSISSIFSPSESIINFTILKFLFYSRACGNIFVFVLKARKMMDFDWLSQNQQPIRCECVIFTKPLEIVYEMIIKYVVAEKIMNIKSNYKCMSNKSISYLFCLHIYTEVHYRSTEYS